MAIDTSNPIIAQNMVALAKKRAGNSRSKMLKMIMPMLSRENGEELAKAIERGDSASFKRVWDSIKGHLAKKLDGKRHTSHSSMGDIIGNEDYSMVTKLLSEQYGQDDNVEDNLEVFGNDMLASMSASNSGLLLVGSGEVKENLRDFLANGIARLDDEVILKIVSCETIRSRFASLQPVTYRIQTQLINVDKDHVMKTFTNIGALVETLSDVLMIAKSYYSKKD